MQRQKVKKRIMFCVLKHLVLCGLLEGFVLGVLASKQDIGQPDCSYDYLDRCGQDLFLWHTDADNVRAPITATELEEHCERQDAAETCVRARAENCTAGLVKGTIRFFLDAIRDEFETRCDPTTAQHDAYLRIAPCLNKLSDKLRNCSIDFILSTDRAANDSIGKPLREKIPPVCCNFAFYTECMCTAVRTCGEDAETFMRSILTTIAGDFVNGACGSYEPNSEVCKLHKRQNKNIATSLENSSYKDIHTFVSALDKLAISLSSR